MLTHPTHTQMIYLYGFLWSLPFGVHFWDPPFGVHLLESTFLESTFWSPSCEHLWSSPLEMSPPLESPFGAPQIRVYHLESIFGVPLLSSPLESIFWSLQSTNLAFCCCGLRARQGSRSSGFPHGMLFVPFWLIDDHLYSAILHSLEQTHCARLWCYMSDTLFIVRFFF